MTSMFVHDRHNMYHDLEIILRVVAVVKIDGVEYIETTLLIHLKQITQSNLHPKRTRLL